MNKRLVLYPFEMAIQTKSGKNHEAQIKHLLFPENMKIIFSRAGFKNIKLGKIADEDDSYFVIATKS